MSYFEFLLIFIGFPICLLGGATWLDRRRARILPLALKNIPAWLAILIHIILAVAYTTPWDNYLVATGVWAYDPAHVTGITLGWVPIEEYTFFIVQTLLTGLWLLYLGRRLPDRRSISPDSGSRVRKISTLGLLIVWIASIILLVADWPAGTYLGLILVWAIPPIWIQAWFGADLLWNRRNLVGLSLASATLYLAAADSLAISTGVWTIDPAQSFNSFLSGVLPVEEFVFFLVTNTLLVFGMALVLNTESRARWATLKQQLRLKLELGRINPNNRGSQPEQWKDPGSSNQAR